MTTTTPGESTVPAPRRRPRGPSFGPVPLACVVVVEVGFAGAVALVATDRRLLPVAGGVLAAAVLLGLLRWRDRWLVRWLGLALRFRVRPRVRDAAPAADPDTDPRTRALRVLVGDVAVAHRPDHDGRGVGLVGRRGAWTAVLAPDTAAVPDGRALLAATCARAGPRDTFPLAAVAGELSDRGVVLDAVSALWHCRPGGAELPADAPATAAYREVLGPLPCLARRDAWLVVRLDPARCPEAVAERGGGTVGAHRALLGAVARLRRVLDDHGVPVRPLGPDEVLRAATDAAVLGAVAARPDGLRMVEQWGAVVVGAVGHTTYGVTGWPSGAGTLDALTGTGATATTLAITLEPGPGGTGDGTGGTGGTDGTDGTGDVGLRGAVRLTARTPDELDRCGRELRELATGLGVRLDPLDGQQAAGLAATLPLGTAP